MHLNLSKREGGIPEGVIENMPWSLYYVGLCRMPINPADARSYLSHAYKVFMGENDRAGIFLSWSAVVDTFLFGWKDFKPLDFWIEEFEGLMQENVIARREATKQSLLLDCFGRFAPSQW
ncbi:MAG: hypothetical protein HY096_06195 [Nitrospinae bacterium]|nr:hypothetical protein [Nitrospinota bacterium]